MAETMTPEESEKRMKAIRKEYGKDPEVVHSEMDDLMAQLLRSLGYGSGVKIYEKQTKYYT